MRKYLRSKRLDPRGPLFPGLKYASMLRILRKLLKKDTELYGMHSFRVGGAQAMALAGRSFQYIMAKGRWKSVESVTRYVETPMEIKISDAKAMTMRRTAPPEAPTDVWGRAHYPEVESLRGARSRAP